MTRLNFPVLSTAALFLTLSLAMGPLGCGGSTSHGDAGGSGGRTGGGGAGTPGDASAGATGGRGGASGAAGTTGTDGGLDARMDANGAGGSIVLVDASGNHYTCADLTACCNTVPSIGRQACVDQTTTGDANCNVVLSNIKAMGFCP